MKVQVICLTEAYLLTKVNVLPNAYEIVRNDGQFDKFKRLAVLYSKQNFKCLGRECFNGVLYIKLATSICSLSDFIMLIVYRKKNLNIIKFVGHITYVVITKHVDFTLRFNEDSFNDGPRKVSLQSLGFPQVVSEATKNRSSCLD